MFLFPILMVQQIAMISARLERLKKDQARRNLATSPCTYCGGEAPTMSATKTCPSCGGPRTEAQLDAALYAQYSSVVEVGSVAASATNESRPGVTRAHQSAHAAAHQEHRRQYMESAPSSYDPPASTYSPPEPSRYESPEPSSYSGGGGSFDGGGASGDYG